MWPPSKPSSQSYRLTLPSKALAPSPTSLASKPHGIQPDSTCGNPSTFRTSSPAPAWLIPSHTALHAPPDPKCPSLMAMFFPIHLNNPRLLELYNMLLSLVQTLPTLSTNSVSTCTAPHPLTGQQLSEFFITSKALLTLAFTTLQDHSNSQGSVTLTWLETPTTASPPLDLASSSAPISYHGLPKSSTLSPDSAPKPSTVQWPLQLQTFTGSVCYSKNCKYLFHLHQPSGVTTPEYVHRLQPRLTCPHQAH
jgi:hypothetical protein